MQNGGKVCNLSVATSERWKDRNSGEQQERTEWHRVVIFDDRLVDVAEDSFKKAVKCIWRVGSRPVNGRTNRGKIGIPPKSFFGVFADGWYCSIPTAKVAVADDAPSDYVTSDNNMGSGPMGPSGTDLDDEIPF